MSIFDDIEKRVKIQLEESNKQSKKDFNSECEHVWIDGAGSYCMLFQGVKGFGKYQRTDCYGKQRRCSHEDKFKAEVISSDNHRQVGSE